MELKENKKLLLKKKKKKKHLGDQRRSPEIKTKEYETQFAEIERLRPRLLLLVYHILQLCASGGTGMEV